MVVDNHNDKFPSAIGTAEDMMQFLWVKRRIFYELLKIEACILMEIYLNTHNISNSDY